jgi:hypothetical protein
MPQRTEAGARLFGVLEEMGWTHGDSVRLAPLVRTLRRRGADVTTGQLRAALHNGQQPSLALLRGLARGLPVPMSRLLPPPPPPPRHPLEAINLADAIDDVKTERRREEARRWRTARRKGRPRMWQ